MNTLLHRESTQPAGTSRGTADRILIVLWVVLIFVAALHTFAPPPG